MSLVRAGLAALALCLAWSIPGVAEAALPAVAAASDLKFALEEIATAFQRHGGGPVRLSFGSSGNFARQIEQGAPFEVFLSADEAYVSRLAAGGLTVGEGALYAVGRIALFVPKGSPVKADAGLRDLAAASADGRLKRLAIANPEHAPYGRAARQALERSGLWPALRDRLVVGESASQAAQFAASGSAQAGIVPYSLVLAPALAGRGSHALLSEGLHEPLRQRMVLLRGAGPVARRFYEFVQGPQAREILARYGFLLPGKD